MNIDPGSNKEEKVTLSFDFGGIGLVLFVVFLILKLTGVIDWKWVLVCLPLIIPVGAIVLGLLIIGIVYLIVAIGEWIDARKQKRNKKE